MKSRVITCAIVLLALALLPTPGAQAKPKKAKVMNVPAASFVMETNTVGYFNSGGTLYITSGGPQYLRAPISLPSGVKVTKIVLVCRDNDAVWDIRCWLHRMSNDFTTNGPIAEVASSSASASWRSFTASTSLTLDTANYLYILNIRMNEAADGSSALSHVKIYYTEV